MRVAVTGTSGLIGRAIASRLAGAGHTVLAVGRAPGCPVPFDLARDRALPGGALSGCEALVHAAGVTDGDFEDRDAAFAKALHGAPALLRAAADAGLDRVAYVSSAHVYGPLEGRIDESWPPDPRSDYAIAHFATEQVFRRSGFPCLVARPCAVYGLPPDLERFRRWSLVPFDFPRQAVEKGRIVLLSHGLQRRNFVPAEGIASLVGWWLEQPARDLVANAPGAHEMTVLDFARLCARIAGEETGRVCAVDHPAPPPDLPAPLEYRTRVAGHLPGPALEDHVRGLVRLLAAKARP